MKVPRETIVAAARSWVGVRYRHQGRSRKKGVDCAGLIACVGRDTGAASYDTLRYHRFPTSGDFYPVFEEGGGILKPLSARKPGDIVTIRVHGITCHLGILTYNNHWVHAFAVQRKVFEQPYGEEWLAQTDRCYAFPNVVDP